MHKWQIEKLVSHSIPFLERSQTKKQLLFTDIIASTSCCSIILNTYKLNFKPTTNCIFTIYATLKNEYYRSRTQVFTENLSDNEFNTSIYFHSSDCDNLMGINIVIQDGSRLHFFSEDIMLCKVMQESSSVDRTLMMYEDLYFIGENYKSKGVNCIEIGFHVFSTKPDDDIHLYNETIIENNTQNNNVPHHGDIMHHRNITQCEKRYKKFELVYDNKVYTLDCFTCIFCERRYKTVFNLQKHIYVSHLYHLLIFIDGKYILTEKSETELSNAYLTGFTYLDNTALKTINSRPIDIEYPQIDFMFIKLRYKRKHTIKKWKIEKKWYKNEIMSCSESFTSVNWDVVLKEQRINKLMNVSQEHVDIINTWNKYVLMRNLRIDEFNFYNVLLEFLKGLPRSNNAVEFLTIMYQKRKISQFEMYIILDEVLAKHRIK